MALRWNKKWEEFKNNNLAIRTNVVLKTHYLLIFHIWSTKFFTVLFTGKVRDKVILLLMILEFQFLHGFKLFILFTYFKTVFAFALRPFLPMSTLLVSNIYFNIVITMGMSIGAGNVDIPGYQDSPPTDCPLGGQSWGGESWGYSITEIFIMTLSSSSTLRSLTETRLTPITTGEVWEFPSESWQGL